MKKIHLLNLVTHTNTKQVNGKYNLNIKRNKNMKQHIIETEWAIWCSEGPSLHYF